ncbi:MAG: hypothetical protein RMM53_03120 [Bacteroidia bacterium]|nr:hypothetical protein [Bacteroidia bacterium]MDW8333189.1 hypothetical protein [Bacteroidia bacterium]
MRQKSNCGTAAVPTDAKSRRRLAPGKCLCAIAAAAIVVAACSSSSVPGAEAGECYYQMLKTGRECSAFDSAFVKNRPDYKNEFQRMLSILGPLQSYKLVSYTELDAQQSVIDGRYGILNYECVYQNDRTQETILYVARKTTGRPTILNVTVNPSKLAL